MLLSTVAALRAELMNKLYHNTLYSDIDKENSDKNFVTKSFIQLNTRYLFTGRPNLTNRYKYNK